MHRRCLLALSGLTLMGGIAAGQLAAPEASTTEAHIKQVEACLPAPVAIKGEQKSCMTLAQAMAEYHVPGVSIAVVHNGAIEWAKSYGVKDTAGHPVTPDTLFQAGSISKPLAAMAALHQVQLGKLSLDGDVNKQLTSWKLPPSPAAPGAVVTLRELLTHTAGLTVHGFPGYAAGAPVPSLVEVLDGAKPANTPAIRLESAPGIRWNYSGGGYTVMQQLLLDQTKQPFAALLYSSVLAPIGMAHSTYEQPLPEPMRAGAAEPFTAEGKPVPGGAHTYPERAAAGLWTTPSDLARYIMENQRSLDGKANHVLSPMLTRAMMTPGMGSWGLGLEIGGSPANPYFSHGGVNEGFESLFVAYEKGGEGAAVMTNAQGGSRLAEAVMRGIAAAYGWPDFRPAARTIVPVSPAVLARYVGVYAPAPPVSLAVTLEGGGLQLQAPGQAKVPLLPESETRFFIRKNNVEFEFTAGSGSPAKEMVILQGGHTTHAPRR